MIFIGSVIDLAIQNEFSSETQKSFSALRFFSQKNTGCIHLGTSSFKGLGPDGVINGKRDFVWEVTTHHPENMTGVSWDSPGPLGGLPQHP